MPDLPLEGVVRPVRVGTLVHWADHDRGSYAQMLLCGLSAWLPGHRDAYVMAFGVEMLQYHETQCEFDEAPADEAPGCVVTCLRCLSETRRYRR